MSVPVKVEIAGPPRRTTRPDLARPAPAGRDLDPALVREPRADATAARVAPGAEAWELLKPSATANRQPGRGARAARTSGRPRRRENHGTLSRLGPAGRATSRSTSGARRSRWNATRRSRAGGSRPAAAPGPARITPSTSTTPEDLPDPRSGWQPHGVHGPSRIVDHAAFRWTDDDFQARPLSSALIYELHVGTFTPEGTFEAAIGKLDHLKELGVTHVEIMPVADFPGRFGWGYDGVNLFAPRHVYGGPEGLKRLVDACHAQGPGGDPRRGLQPPRPLGQLPAEVRALLHRSPPHPLGRRPELRRPVQRRGPPLLLRQRPDVAPRLPLRRPPARRRPRDRRHLGDPLPGAAGHRGRRPQGPPRPPPRPDRRERPERPPDRPPLGDRRVRDRRPVVRRLPPRPPLGHHRREERLLLRLRLDRRTWPPPSRPPTSTPAAAPSSGSGATAGRRSA